MSGDKCNAAAVSPADVLAFWRVAGPQKWFKKDPAFDSEVVTRFLPVWRAAAAGKLSKWAETPEGALALLIVLDQFPRNMFRGDARAFETDAAARAVADHAIARGLDRRVPPSERKFFYLPFMHCEDMRAQERCLSLSRQLDDPEFEKYAANHADIIRQFGRFPHRNVILGRATTPEEQAFLDAGGFAG